MLAAGKPDTAVGWPIVAREIALLAARSAACTAPAASSTAPSEIETDLHGELEQIRVGSTPTGPTPLVELDAETEAARRARDPLGPDARGAAAPADVDDAEAVSR